MEAAGRALLLVIVASTLPWAVGRLFGGRGALPLDLGCSLPDGKRLFGDHKTWRGLVAGIVGGCLAAWLLDLGVGLGAGFGAVALAGDALSSAIKRRFGLSPGAGVPGLDQLPESLLPLLAFAGPLGLSLVQCLAVAALFTLLDLAATPLRRRW